MRLTRAAFHMRRHPVVWNQASSVVIHKTAKDNYTKPKAYRYISVLSGMGKVVEKVAAELLSEEPER